MKHPVRRYDAQMSLPFKREASDFEAELSRALGKDVSLTVTDNAATMIAVKKGHGRTAVRLHHMFLTAGPPVVDELARYIADVRIKTPLLRGFIRDNRKLIRRSPARQETMKTRGSVHDLRAVFDRVNAEYFGDRIAARITWGRSGGARVRRRTLGGYYREADLIRINPVLDRRRVPAYFVEFIVYHEMLHADMGVEEREGRRRIHSKEFRRRERLFKHYERAVMWEKGSATE